MSEKTMIPLINKEQEVQNEGSACSGCGGKGGCCGAFGIKAGSEKNIVFRNIFLYLTMGGIIFAVAYIITRILTWVNG